MPHFTAIALDRLIDPRASESVDKSSQGSMTLPRHSLNPKSGFNSKLERVNSTSSTQWRVQPPQMTPSLYTTPEATPVPDSPSSFLPSPYIINHKRRGACLVKNQPEINSSSCKNTSDDVEDSVGGRLTIQTSMPNPVQDYHANGGSEGKSESNRNGKAAMINLEPTEDLNGGLLAESDFSIRIPLTPRTEGDGDDFYDPLDSLSYTSNTDIVEHGAPDHSSKIASVGGEFYDACEELSVDSGPQYSLQTLEEELREMRLSLLMEIEKRRQAEEVLQNMQHCWQRMREELSLVGLALPADPATDAGQLDTDSAENLSQQVHIIRSVSEAIGRGTAKAEAENVMEVQLKAKNFEIMRLSDRLHYYEAMNQEMSQRNQEAVETARRLREMRKRKQKRIWVSIAVTVAIGAVALSWSYHQAGKGSSSHHAYSQAPEHTEPFWCILCGLPRAVCVFISDSVFMVRASSEGFPDDGRNGNFHFRL
ncbi:hypothetical protein SAY87_025056 [Trapa incisa]|uniref:Uncharacterized protein n=1 Tax=Trapa incisa TaxID=236973 RepID=A0AAN7GKV4_9MYRT|nr:hypothetical protein SAY87_025056 [Trapa incisa]